MQLIWERVAKMAEYIDRANLIARIEYYVTHTPEGKGEHYAYSVVLNEVLNRPAADVVPVVHGKWLNSTMLQSNQRICSVCKSTVRQPSYDRGEYTLYPYCPYCTAKMRENNEI